jgi:hypothetical protein
MAYTSYEGSKAFKDWCKFRAIDISDGWEIVAAGKGPRLTYVHNRPAVTAEADADWVAQSEARGVEIWANVAKVQRESEEWMAKREAEKAARKSTTKESNAA